MIEVQALKFSELESIQSFAECILDSVATLKAGRQTLRGFLLKINDEMNIEIVGKDVECNVQ